MRELLYTVLELEEWNKEVECSFCPGLNKAVCQIRTRSKITEKIIANDEACQDCKEKFENNELLKCKDCGRLQIETYIDIHTGKYICRCVRHQENTQEKELPILPHDRRPNAFYERQINSLREEKEQLTEEVETHLDALEISKDWHQRQKQELLDKIKELEAEVERLKKQTPQELIEEINELRTQLQQLQEQNNQLTAQIEVKEVKKQLSWLRLRK